MYSIFPITYGPIHWTTIASLTLTSVCIIWNFSLIYGKNKKKDTRLFDFTPFHTPSIYSVMVFINQAFGVDRTRALYISAELYARVIHFCLCVKCENHPVSSAAVDYFNRNMSEFTNTDGEKAMMWFTIGATMKADEECALMWMHIISLKKDTLENTIIEIYQDIKLQADSMISPNN